MTTAGGKPRRSWPNRKGPIMSEKITVRRDHYEKMLNALRRIARYTPPDKIRRDAERDHWGPNPDEMVDMAYENVIAEAKFGLRGVRNAPAK